ncbi:MAG: carbon-nitrogen hydrolase family protein [Desulfobulbus sp.]|nr:carbon-nitrogen hydrolase family protein [Desulfobulbus sp.]
MPSLRLALLHLTAAHKQPEVNRRQLFDLFRRAGDAGAQLVIAPEMAISGYAFTGRGDIAPFTETAEGPTLSGLAEIVREYGMYGCIGLAEREASTNIFYNSAFVLDPLGEVACRYHKINAEHRWACPGNPREDNTFLTPWGRMGVLICSDSYPSLLARITALRGADLLLIPANWPPTGLDPRELWQARALENGVHVAACNRTGMDLSMDCSQGPSVLYSPEGTAFIDHNSPNSQLLLADIPLNADNRLSSDSRLACLQKRSLGDISPCYLNLVGIADLTAFLRLPQPGSLAIHCSTSTKVEEILSELKANKEQLSSPTLHLLPAGTYNDQALEKLQSHCDLYNTAFALTRLEEHPGLYFFQVSRPRQIMPRWGEHATTQDKLASVDYGPSRVLLAPQAALRHPEPILAAAKQGCDLVAICCSKMSWKDTLVAGVRTIDNIAVALASENGAGIWMTPEGHQRWEEILAGPGQSCKYLLDTHRTRKKRFQDRVDYQQLLRGNTADQ